MQRGIFVLLTVVAVACGDESATTTDPPVVATSWGYDDLSRDEIERGRRDPSWRHVVPFDTALDMIAAPFPETWDDITAAAIEASPMHLPIRDDAEGPSVVRAQILLDRALFSPGIMDGRWGKNSEKAVYWFQQREGLPATGEVDSATFARLVVRAGRPARLVVEHTLSAADVAGPFVAIPADIYQHAELACSCYESLSEKLGEVFHSAPALLAKLNPGVDLDALVAGDRLRVPLVRDANAAITERIARIIISDRGHYVHAVDGEGRIVLHFPSTLGSTYQPSPAGDFEVASITHDPWWHYQPELLGRDDDAAPDAHIPPGPNSAVGVVWMALSKPHYGIHGTNRPETIGYATSAGCVRLTNWDARFLARRIESGVPVEFRDT
jgi:lipoprotein-anchoring transpeptidase ErfK/SrfK